MWETAEQLLKAGRIMHAGGVYVGSAAFSSLPLWNDVRLLDDGHLLSADDQRLSRSTNAKRRYWAVFEGAKSWNGYTDER